MNIFVDVDDTLYNTSSVLTGNSVAEMLIAELRAPLFEHAKETIEKFNQNGHMCWIVTSRGFVDEIEEMKNLFTKLRKDEFINRGKPSLFKGWANLCVTKYDGIEKYYEHYNSGVISQECILIDDDIFAVLETAKQGVKSILFNPNEEEIDAQTQQALHDLKVSKARSWEEVEKIVDTFCKGPEKE